MNEQYNKIYNSDILKYTLMGYVRDEGHRCRFARAIDLYNKGSTMGEASHILKMSKRWFGASLYDNPNFYKLLTRPITHGENSHSLKSKAKRTTKIIIDDKPYEVEHFTLDFGNKKPNLFMRILRKIFG